MCRLILGVIVAVGLLLCRPVGACAATAQGTVQEIKKDLFTVNTEQGQMLILKPSIALQDGVAGLDEPLYTSKLKDMKVGQLIRFMYISDRKTGEFICTHLYIVGERRTPRMSTGGTVKEIKKDRFTVITEKTGETLVLKPSDDVLKDLPDRKKRGQMHLMKDLKVGQYIDISYRADNKTNDLICIRLSILRQPKP